MTAHINVVLLTESLLAGEGPGEGDTVGAAGGNIEGREVGVVPGDWDRPALRVDSLGGVTGPARLRDAMLSGAEMVRSELYLQSRIML